MTKWAVRTPEGVLLVDCHEIEVTRAGALAMYVTTGPGLHREIVHLLAPGQWLAVAPRPTT